MLPKFVLLVTTLILITPMVKGQSDDNVYQWRGTHRDGIYHGPAIAKEWPANGPNLMWQYDNLPAGYSSVIIVNDTIYTTGRRDTLDYLVALNSKGNLIYEVPYGSAWNKSYTDSRCTPTYKNGKLYLSSGQGIISCVKSSDGSIVWQKDAITTFNGEMARWGVSESLLIVDDKVIFTPGGASTTVVALSTKDGATIWESESLNDGGAFVSPLLIEWQGQRQIIAMTMNFIIAVNPEDGSTLWSYKFGNHQDPERGKPGNPANTPVYHNGQLYFTCGYNQESIKLEIAPDSRSVKLLWADKVLDNHIGAVVLIDNFIYGTNWLNNKEGNWVCLDWQSGKVQYETKWNDKGSIISTDGMLICYSEKPGEIGLVKPGPDKFELISSFPISSGSGPHWAHPVVLSGVLYVRHGSALLVYDLK